MLLLWLKEFYKTLVETLPHLDDIIAGYSTQERAYGTDKEDALQRCIPRKEAIEALQTLHLYKKQQDEGNSQFISGWGRHERVIRQQTETIHN